jgi:O-antigen ligase
MFGWNIADGDYNRIVSTILLFFCMIALLMRNRIQIPPGLQQVFFIIILLLLISTGIGIHTFLTIGMPLNGVFVVLLRFIIEIVLIIFCLNFFSKPGHLNTFMTSFFKPALCIFFIVSFFQIATLSYIDVQGVNRISGPFGSPTTLGGFLHLFIAITLYNYEGKFSTRVWLLIAVQYLLLILSGSVAIIVANILFLFLIAWKRRWINLKKFYLFFPLVLVVTVSGIIYKWDSIVLRLSVLFDLNSFELVPGSSLRWRLDAWKSYLSLLGNDPIKWLFGLGIGSQRYILHPFYPHSLWRIFDAPGTHNDYLAILIDFGIVGLVLFACGLIALLNFMTRAEKKDNKFYYLRFYFISVLLIMLTENYIDQLIMFVLIIFITAIVKSKNAEEHALHEKTWSSN